MQWEYYLVDLQSLKIFICFFYTRARKYENCELLLRVCIFFRSKTINNADLIKWVRKIEQVKHSYIEKITEFC